LRQLVHTNLSKINISRFGESGLVCDFGNEVTHYLNNIVWNTREQIQSIDGVLYGIPTYNKIVVYFDKNRISAKSLSELIKQIKLTTGSIASNKIWKIPVCYEAGYELDLDRVSAYLDISKEETIKSHCSKPLYVYGYGGLPGHPKYGNFDLCAPGRLLRPRSVTPGGSVGWVGTQGGICTADAPGGWNIVGRTPMKLFDITSADPCKIKPGESIQFYPITLGEFNAYC
jgi:inhibitor of KinA